ncbi:hypothetical protein CCP3SC5AM1_630008 [Gammaproteobacteria bacterium]
MQRSFSSISGTLRQTVSSYRLHLPFSELRAEEAFVSESCISLQRSPIFRTQAGKPGFIHRATTALAVG